MADDNKTPEQLEKEARLANEAAKREADMLELLGKRADLEKRIATAQGNKNAAIEAEIKLKGLQFTREKDELLRRAELGDITEKEINALAKKSEQLKILTSRQKESAEMNSVLGSAASNLALSYLNVSDAGTTLNAVWAKGRSATDAWRTATEKAEGASKKFGATLKHVGRGFKNLLKSDAADKFRKMFDPLNQLNNEMQRASDLAEKVQQNNQNLYRSTGQVSSGNFALGEQMKRLAMDTESVTIASGEMSKAQIALNESYMDFNSLSQDTINDLTKTNALLDQAGMSSRTSAENFTFFVKSMGQTAKEGNKTNLKLLDLAQSMKQSPEAIGQAFKNSRGHLAAYGSAFMKHFSKMLGASKKLGIEVGKLLDVGAKLDTIEGAAEASGRLNAMLELRGEDRLDALAIMKASDDEKFAMIAKAMSASKVDLKGGGADVRGTMRSLASAMGMDVADIQKMINSNKGLTSEMKKMSDIEKNSNKTSKDLDQTNKKAMTTQETAAKKLESLQGPMTEALNALKKALAENTLTVKAAGAIGSVALTIGQNVAQKAGSKLAASAASKIPFVGKALAGAIGRAAGSPVEVVNFADLAPYLKSSVGVPIIDDIINLNNDGHADSWAIEGIGRAAGQINLARETVANRVNTMSIVAAVRTSGLMGAGGLASLGAVAAVAVGAAAVAAAAGTGYLIGKVINSIGETAKDREDNKAMENVSKTKLIGQFLSGKHTDHAVGGKRRINKQAQSSWDSLSMQQQHNYCSENGKMPQGVTGHCGQVFAKARKPESEGGIELGGKNKKVQATSAKNRSANTAAGQAKGIANPKKPKVNDFMVNANVSDQVIGVKEGGLVAKKLDKLIELMSRATEGKEIVIKLDGRTVAKSTISLINNDFYALG